MQREGRHVVRLILGIVLASAWLALAAGPASACLWDREMVPHEKQFKSNYLDQSGEGESGLLARRGSYSTGPLLAGAGVVMLLGGVVIGFARGRAVDRELLSRKGGGEDRS